MTRIGIYSGTFDPVHNGHIGFALRAQEIAKLDKVVFIPERSPRGKQDVTSFEHRFGLLVAATEPYPQLSVRMLNTDQFSVQETLPELLTMFEDAELSLLVGSDVVPTFADKWSGLDELFTRMELIVGVRSGDVPIRLIATLVTLETSISPRFTVVDSPLASASSTRVRRGLAMNDVPPEVFQYIQLNNLYGGSGCQS